MNHSQLDLYDAFRNVNFMLTLSECKQMGNIESVQSNIPACLSCLKYESNNIDEKR